MNEMKPGHWADAFDKRQGDLIRSCRQYTADGAPGLPGHQLMLIVAKMAELLDKAEADVLKNQERELRRR